MTANHGMFPDDHELRARLEDHHQMRHTSKMTMWLEPAATLWNIATLGRP